MCGTQKEEEDEVGRYFLDLNRIQAEFCRGIHQFHLK